MARTDGVCKAAGRSEGHGEFFCNKHYARPHLKHGGCPQLIPFCHLQTHSENLGVRLGIIPSSQQPKDGGRVGTLPRLPEPALWEGTTQKWAPQDSGTSSSRAFSPRNVWPRVVVGHGSSSGTEQSFYQLKANKPFLVYSDRSEVLLQRWNTTAEAVFWNKKMHFLQQTEKLNINHCCHSNAS